MKPRRHFPPATYAAIIARQNHLCACGCGEPLGSDPRGFQFDHIREIWDDGEDAPENLQALRLGHHKRKTSDGTKRRAKRRAARCTRNAKANAPAIGRIIV